MAAAAAAEAKWLAQHKIAEAAMAIDAADPGAISKLSQLLSSLHGVQPPDEHQALLQEIDKLCVSLPLSVGLPRDPSSKTNAFDSAAAELTPE